MMEKLYQRLGRLLLCAACLGAPAAVQAAANPYAGWHLPVPAGTWTISRGPCGSDAPFDHDCQYYENQCAVDLIPPAGSMENVPVLAPAAGQVFFRGERSETGLMLLLRHPDGRVSGYMHLARVVVALDEAISAGQVIAYAGHTGTGRPHLHFFVQPNAVERTCTGLDGLDTLNYRAGQAVSGNLAWSDLTLVEPPAALPDWLPILLGRPPARVVLPQRVVLRPGTAVNLPVVAGGPPAVGAGLGFAGRVLRPVRRTAEYALFQAPVVAPAAAGDYERRLEITLAGQPQTAVLRLSVPASPAPAPVLPVLLPNAELASPAGWSVHTAAPQLCWQMPAGTEWRARVVLAGPTPTLSPWLTAACWQPPALASGTYYWKVFLMDAAGAQNRPNQRPFAFVIARRP